MSTVKQKVGFLEHCEEQIARSKTNVMKMRLALQDTPKDPLYVLEWSDDAFTAAAVVSVYSYVVAGLSSPDSKATLETTRDFAHKKVIDGAKNIKRSTSVLSNLAQAERTAAWAQLLEDVEAFLKST